jgi:hypothetical protein
MNGGPQFFLGEGLMPTHVTVPSESRCHYITDDELRRLGEMRKDLVMEICLAATGLFFGSGVPAFEGFRRFNATPQTATGTDLLSMMMCVAALVVAIVTGFQWHVRQKSHVDLVDEIRSRPKVAVRLVHDNAA